MTVDDELDAGTKNRDFYTAAACQNAFGSADLSVLDGSLGFAANRARMLQVYTYYQAMSQKAPDIFLWMGLAHLAGASIMSGLDDAPGDPEIEQVIVNTAKSVFQDLAWLHEAYLDSPAAAIALASARDASGPAPAASYAQSLTDIFAGTPERIVAGNEALLRNEQASIVQPGLEALAGNGNFAHGRAFTSAVHPYHRDFLTAMPQGTLSSFDDRWAWIMEPEGMWAKWVAMPSVAPGERDRLVALDMAHLMAQNFGPTVQALLPAGADDQ